jgi:hypothetical protein
MPKCAACTTTWTSLGMTMCPICGAKVDDPPAAPDRPKEKAPPEAAPAPATVRRPAPDPLIELSEPAVFGPPIERRKLPSKTPTVVPVEEAPRPPVAAPASPPRGIEEAARPPAPEPPPRPRSTFRKAETAPPVRTESRRVWSDRSDDLIAVPCESSVAEELFSSPNGRPFRSYPERSGGTPPARDTGGSALNDTGMFPVVRPGLRDQVLPAPARPLNAPIILGTLALVSVIMVPISVAFEGDRIFGILGFCLSGFFLPFGPIAWIAGLAAERRRREQGLRSESRVVAGRLMGELGTVLLVIEVAVLLILIAALRLSGGLPMTFWAH